MQKTGQKRHPPPIMAKKRPPSQAEKRPRFTPTLLTRQPERLRVLARAATAALSRAERLGALLQKRMQPMTATQQQLMRACEGAAWYHSYAAHDDQHAAESSGRAAGSRPAMAKRDVPKREGEHRVRQSQGTLASLHWGTMHLAIPSAVRPKEHMTNSSAAGKRHVQI